MKNNNLKLGAMFGLDARIALAIFGALSVISGAALYSAIQSSKLEQWRQYFEEHAKASEAYFLDTGQELPPYKSDSRGYYYASDLVNNRENLKSWNGPYIEGSLFAIYAMKDSFTAKINSGSYYMILLRQASTWTQMNDVTSDEICVIGSSDCAEWHRIDAATPASTASLLALFNSLDDFIDSGDGALAGNVRYNTYGNDSIMYKGRNRKRVF